MSKAKNPHYYKRVQGLQHIDVYRVLALFGVADPCIQHAVKKLLVTGGRAAGKSRDQDVDEAIQSLQRWQEMQAEDAACALVQPPSAGAWGNPLPEPVAAAPEPAAAPAASEASKAVRPSCPWPANKCTTCAQPPSSSLDPGPAPTGPYR